MKRPVLLFATVAAMAWSWLGQPPTSLAEDVVPMAGAPSAPLGVPVAAAAAVAAAQSASPAVPADALPSAPQDAPITIDNWLTKESAAPRSMQFGVSMSSYAGVTYRWQLYDVTQGTWAMLADSSMSNWVTVTAPHYGTFSVYVQATAPSGSSATSTYSWTVGPIAINGWVTNPVTDPMSLSLGVAMSGYAGVTYTWKLYDVAKQNWTMLAASSASNWITATAPHPGDYSVYVSATASDGSTANSYYNWTAVAPAVTITGWATPQVVADPMSMAFGVAMSSYTGVTYTWKLYDVAQNTWTLVAADSPSNWVTVKAPHMGTYWVYVAAKGPFGSIATSTYTWTLSPIAIQGWLTQPVADPMALSFGVVMSSYTGVTYTWKLYDVSKQIWTVLVPATASNWVTVTAPHPGDYWVYVSATDRNGTVDSASYGWAVAAPVTTINGWAARGVADPMAMSFGVAMSSYIGMTYQWQMYDVTNQTWTMLAPASRSNWITATAPHMGTYWINVVATGPFGSTATSTYTWTMGPIAITGWTTQPVTALTMSFAVSTVNATGATFQWKYYDAAAMQWTLLSDFSRSNLVTFKAPHIGEFWIYVLATSPDGTQADSMYTWMATSADWAKFATTTCTSPGPGPDLATADRIVSAEVNLNGSGSGFQGKVMMTDGPHAVSFGLQYDTASYGGPAFSGKAAFLSENVADDARSYIYHAWCVGALGTDIPVMLAHFPSSQTVAMYVAGVYIGSQPTYYSGGGNSAVEGNVKHNGDSVNATLSNVMVGSYGSLKTPSGFVQAASGQGLGISLSSASTAANMVASVYGAASGFGPRQDWDSSPAAGSAAAWVTG